MAAPVRRTVVKAFFAALASREPARIAPFVDDDAIWSIVGPIDLFHFCGERRGKAAVLELYETVIPAVLHVTGFVPEIMLVDADRAAALSRLTGRQRASGRTISYRCAHFLKFRRDRVIELRSIIDSFDAAEQVLGRPIDLSPETCPPVAVV